MRIRSLLTVVIASTPLSGNNCPVSFIKSNETNRTSTQQPTFEKAGSKAYVRERFGQPWQRPDGGYGVATNLLVTCRLQLCTREIGTRRDGHSGVTPMLSISIMKSTHVSPAWPVLDEHPIRQVVPQGSPKGSRPLTRPLQLEIREGFPQL